MTSGVRVVYDFVSDVSLWLDTRRLGDRCSQRHDAGWISNGQFAWRHVFPYRCSSRHDRPFTDLNTMANQRESADDRPAANEHLAGPKLSRTKFVQCDFHPHAYHHVIFDSQQLWESGIDPDIGGDKDIAADSSTGPAQQRAFRRIPGELEYGQQQPRFGVKP